MVSESSIEGSANEKDEALPEESGREKEESRGAGVGRGAGDE